MSESLTFDVVVLGGGAAGLMCALTAGQRGRRVLVLEHMPAVGKKILISGGGRCNFTNINASPDQYISDNPHFCKSALARFQPEDFIRLLHKHHIRFHEKKLGQLFCNQSAQEIIQLLLAECRAAGVEIWTNVKIQRIEKTTGFKLHTSWGDIPAQSLVVATGGLSVPKIGATDLGYRIAKQFGLRVTALKPGLVPLLIEPSLQLDTLRGIAVPTEVEAAHTVFTENTLFTHFGLSGPAILQISSYWHPGQSIAINWLPDIELAPLLQLAHQQREATQVANWLTQWLPRRMAQHWAQQVAGTKPIGQLVEREQQHLIRQLHHWSVIPTGTSGYSKAEVTVGGIDTRDLSSQTMEAKSMPGLFFIGEVVDVTGWLGGYNFQWAWASGYAAGQRV